MKILTLDAGLAHTGVAVFGYEAGRGWKILDCMLVETEKMAKKRGIRVADDNADRVQKTFRALSDMISKHGVRGMAAELPSGGAQSAAAIKSMAIATAIPACLAEAFRLPAEWVTPRDVKVAMTGSATASKDEMMKAVIDMHGKEPFGEFIKRTSGEPVGKFEHVADACGVFQAVRNGQLARTLESMASVNPA